MGAQVRRGPRLPFYAAAEITELQSQARLNARTSEVSHYGCYMDMLNPFPIGMAVATQIVYQEEKFEAKGRVLYSQPNMGMGVSFDEMDPALEKLLLKWIAELEGNA
jgi:PilZ domain